MNINDLIIFQSVAEHSSFTKAAAASNTVQSNVTARIKFLESEFNTTLFERTPKKINLTESGIELLKTTKEILLLIEKAKKSISNVDQELKGLIKIGCIHTTAALRLPGILAGFNEKFPEVDFKLKTGTTAMLVTDVLAHKLDGAFVAGQVDDLNLSVTPIVTEQLGVVTSSLIDSIESLFEGKKPIKIIVFSDGCSYRRQFESYLKAYTNKKLTVIEHDTLEGILNATEAGAGITLLPQELIHKHYRYKDLRVFPLPKGMSEVTTYFIKRNDIMVSEAYQTFFEMMVGGYKFY
ncbi:LysR family transcriptional regulator [Pedobacter hiemivivus]|uniref:LysR family transcriptional regulator n=1 Tax=Pedobacter hiemivivus TaxID=2530454 RepID=A0A4R0NA80_9SPHI|nr:LysR family transcriptional regulator [Pedobacter hiemivivus]TCC97148.1 LysR family transcriptional regulator [Pedobacter hiemivivus]